ncbi:GTP-binding protein [Streptomyces sp. NBC_01622]|uniref:GTP-binding protein n=1 Tax=Streptomyces sp. NBC_01622 TaxID=2975903 RepID=UPI0038658C7D|nr:GTP-binding protein [Streptomyces sp. NBC_01622]
MPDLSVAIVAGLHADARRATVAQLLHDVPGSVVLHHDLATAAAGTVIRTIRDATGILDAGEAPLVNDCACCALREDLVPELRRLAATGQVRLAIVELWDSVEPKAMAEVITSGGLTVTGVITAVDPALLLPCLGNGDDLADAGLAAAATDQRTVADTFARQLEYAPALAVLDSEEAYDEDRELLGQLHPTALQIPLGGGDLAAPARGEYGDAGSAWPVPGDLPDPAWPVPGDPADPAGPAHGDLAGSAWPVPGVSAGSARPAHGVSAGSAWPVPGVSAGSARPAHGDLTDPAGPAPGDSAGSAGPVPGDPAGSAWPAHGDPAGSAPPPRSELAAAALAGFDVEAAAAAQHPACALLPVEADAYGVSTFVWHRCRPFHPERLYAALEDLTCAAARSRGRFWLADKPDALLHWDAAGGALCVEGAGPWLASLPDAAWELVPPVRRAAAALDWHPEHGDRCQHLVFTSPGLDRDGLERLLDHCLLTDTEYAAGRAAWKRLPPAFDALLEI